MKYKLLVSACALAALACIPSTTWAGTGYGRLTGIILDPAGTPQMGATVWLNQEDGRARAQLLSDQNGGFTSPRLHPGLYSARVTLSGFLPASASNIRVSADVTTIVHIELDSVFSSLDQLRRKPAQPTENDDWKWVLRSASDTRPVLQLRDDTQSPGTIVVAASHEARRPHAQVEMTSGMRQPGSSSGLPGVPATAVSYDQSLGAAGRLLLAGQMSYEGAPNAGGQVLPGVEVASIWLPSGELGRGPETVAIIRQGQSGPGGRSIRNMRFEHSEQMAIGGRLKLDYGAEYLMAGVAGMTTSVRPRARIGMRLSRRWSTEFSLETEAGSYRLRAHDPALDSALDALDTLPVLIWRNGANPMIEGGWHEEISARREVGSRGTFEMAGFHDFSQHQAVFGFDESRNPGSGAEQLSRPYAHDAGSGGSWGARAVYRQRISDNLEVAAIYSWAGALVPQGSTSLPSQLSEVLATRYRHSVAARISGKVPGARTQVAASYKWLSGTIVSRQDLFGEAALSLDPYMDLSIQQPLPSFHAGHWQALADFRNLLSQGYVGLNGQDGGIVLVPVVRSFRGGVVFQF